MEVELREREEWLQKRQKGLCTLYIVQHPVLTFQNEKRRNPSSSLYRHAVDPMYAENNPSHIIITEHTNYNDNISKPVRYVMRVAPGRRPSVPLSGIFNIEPTFTKMSCTGTDHKYQRY